MEEAVFFDKLQDLGVDMTDKQRADYEKNKEKKERGRITYNGRLYQNLHQLAELVYNKMVEHKEVFDDLPTASNKGKVVHRIGKQIAATRCQVTRADIHTRAPGEVNLDLFNSDEYKDKNELFVLAQRDIIQFCCHAYRKKVGVRKMTNDDKVRAIGIAMTDPNVRSLIGDMLGKTKGGSRRQLDAQPASSRSGFKMLYDKFVDQDFTVPIPELWDEEATRKKIIAKVGSAQFEIHCQFDPNDESRIKMDWTEKEVQAIFRQVAVDYQKMMDKWMMGTGGGPGAPENFSIWQDREETETAGYIEQACDVYLSLVYIWDKEYDFVFVTKKDSLPSHMHIGDHYNGDDGGDDDDDDEVFDFTNNDNNNSNQVTPRPSSRTSNKSPIPRTNNNEVAALTQAVQDMVAAKRSNDAVTKEILELIKHGSESNNSARGNWNDIEQAQRVIKSFKADLEEHKSKKQKVLDSGVDKTDKKVTKLDEKIKATRRMIKISEEELARQMKEIEGDDAGGLSSDSDSD